MRHWLWLALLLSAACTTPQGELQSLAELEPLDYSVLLSGGAFVDPPTDLESPLAATFTPGPDGEAFPLQRVVDVLEAARVFRRVEVDSDPAHRRALLQRLPAAFGVADGETLAFLQAARDRGCDWLLAVERLQNGPIEAQGINGRWPITLATWFLLGVGMLIPDHTFESRATLRVTLRDLQSGRVVHEQLLPAGPVDLSLLERSNFLGVITHILVPPFWVGDDDANVADTVRAFTERRLLLSLARDLKGELARQRLRDGSIAAFELRRLGAAWQLRIVARESLAALRLRQGDQALGGREVAAVQSALLASVVREGDRLVYTATLNLPPSQQPLQVLVASIVGNVASATLRLEEAR